MEYTFIGLVEVLCIILRKYIGVGSVKLLITDMTRYHNAFAHVFYLGMLIPHSFSQLLNFSTQQNKAQQKIGFKPLINMILGLRLNILPFDSLLYSGADWREVWMVTVLVGLERGWRHVMEGKLPLFMQGHWHVNLKCVNVILTQLILIFHYLLKT